MAEKAQLSCSFVFTGHTGYVYPIAALTDQKHLRPDSKHQHLEANFISAVRPDVGALLTGFKASKIRLKPSILHL